MSMYIYINIKSYSGAQIVYNFQNIEIYLNILSIKGTNLSQKNSKAKDRNHQITGLQLELQSKNSQYKKEIVVEKVYRQHRYIFYKVTITAVAY